MSDSSHRGTRRDASKRDASGRDDREDRLERNDRPERAVRIVLPARSAPVSSEVALAANAFNRIRHEFERGAHLQRLAVVVPMFREEKRIASSIACLAASELHRSDITFCFVDDGSTDATVDAAESAIVDYGLGNATVLRLPRNRGKGAAVRAGILHVAPTAHVVGFLDADLSLHPSEVMTALARMELAHADVLVGERIVDVATQPKLRRLSSLIFRRIGAGLVETGVVDPQCAMKLFRCDVAAKVFSALETDGFAFDVEILARLKRDRFVIAQTPVLWQHQPGSQVNPATDAVSMVRELLAIRKSLRLK